MTIVIEAVENLEDAGYVAYWQGIHRTELATQAEQRGWDDAHGEDCYYRAMMAQAKEVDEAQGEYSDWRWA
jgi:hypothetical protein